MKMKMMMLKSLLCLSLVVLVAEGSLLGGWKPIKDLSAKYVVEIATFAIKAHNEQAKTSLVYDKVVQGSQQVVAGTNYKLVIAVKDGKQYEAIVWDKPYEKVRKLQSFKAV